MARKIPRVHLTARGARKVSNPDLHSAARALDRRLAKASKVRSPSLVNQGIQFASLLNDGGKSKTRIF